MSCGQDSNQDPRDRDSNAQPFDLLQTITQTFQHLCDHIGLVCTDNIICQMHFMEGAHTVFSDKISNIVQIG